MTNYRENLLTKMIHLYGFEHEEVIKFANMCDQYENDTEWDKLLGLLVTMHECEAEWFDEEE